MLWFVRETEGLGGGRSLLALGVRAVGGGLGEEVCLLVARGTRPMSITARTSKSQGSSLV